MKTQISNLRNGSLKGVVGSNQKEVETTWEKVKSENPKFLNVLIETDKFKLLLSLDAYWSLSGKTVTYQANLPNEIAERFGIVPTKKEKSFISIQFGVWVKVSNGKNSYNYICPSKVEIL